ncbi:MAG: helix-turn-helix domain-containing protein [Xanthobacteraceae bacterium]
MKNRDKDTAAPVAYSIDEACRATSLCRTSLYKLISDGKVQAKKIGGRTVIAADALHRLINEAPDFNAA